MNGLLKTLIKPDWDDNPKRSEILDAANLLQIGEFQSIQLAYKVWYKQNFPEEKINKIFNIISKNEIPTQGIFYNGQILDAYELINSLLKSAKKEVILIDNYVDDSVLTIFSKYTIYKCYKFI